MGTKEDLISELRFLDEAIVAMDEKPKKGKSSRNKEVPETSIEQSLLEAIDGLSDDAALAVLDTYRKMPKEVKTAVKGVYDTLATLGGNSTMEDLKTSLANLKAACGEEYSPLYTNVVKDAKKIVPKIQTRLLGEWAEEN